MNELMNFLQAVYSNDISRAFGLAIGILFVFGVTSPIADQERPAIITTHRGNDFARYLGTFLESLLGFKTSISIKSTKVCLSFLKV